MLTIGDLFLTTFLVQHFSRVTLFKHIFPFSIHDRSNFRWIRPDFLPALEGRGFPSRGFIVPTIDSGLHLSFGGQSSGSENHSHLDRVGRGLSLLSSSPLKEKEDDGCSSHSPIKPPIELGRSIVSVTKRFLKKEIFKPFIRGLSIPALKGEAFRPLNPLLCNS
ncbi:hypothetical protein [Sulfuracidifex metallicus]|uniref:hypothetical protein n=1 Tax=Sulfuracidifex metallicus TaxID=47303 RepID=UPI0012DC1D4E|nr:hypothetical protein [Sulfuracidifex metallicus]